MSKKLFKKIHLWLSVPFGLIITVVCLSGAALVFESEITTLYREQARKVSPDNGRSPLEVEELQDKIEKVFNSPVAVERVVKDPDPAKAYLFVVSSPVRGAIWIDQYTGEIRDKSGKLPFFEVMLGLHRNLMIPPSYSGVQWGRIIVGISVISFIIILLSGIAIWVPKKRSQWRLRCNLFSLHTLGGIYVMVFLLLMALTGLTWSFGWWHDIVYTIPGVSRGLVTALHIGAYAGVTGRIIAFIAALFGATLPLTGYWLWWKRIRKA